MSRMAKFHSNVSFMSAGIIFKLFISFVATAIYIREIGSEGYAVIGTVFSLFSLIAAVDIPFFLGLVRYNSERPGQDRDQFNNIFNTLYNSALASNLFFLLLLPVIVFLSVNVYKKPDLVIYYILALAVYCFTRMINFLQQFFRANRNEKMVQDAYITSLTVELLLNIMLMFVFGLGVLSIFVSALLSRALEYAILCTKSKAHITFSPYLSVGILMKIIREYSLQELISKMLRGIVIWGGLFISTFFLDSRELGILTIFISVSYMIKRFFAPLFVHLSPVMSEYHEKGKLRRIKETMLNISHAVSMIFIMAMLFLIIVGRPIYMIYFGQQMQGTYPLFLIFICIQIFYEIFIAASNYLFITDIRFYNKLNFITLFAFLLVLFPSVSYLGLAGVVISYLFLYVIRSIFYLGFHLYHLHRMLAPDDAAILTTSVILLISGLVFGRLNYSISMLPGLLLLVILLAVLVFAFKVKIGRSYHFLTKAI